MYFTIGAISFLNTVPLVDWFGTTEGKRHTLLRVLPSQLTDLLRTRAAHVGLLPMAEILRGYSDGILTGTGIACRGHADSVKIFSTGPLQDLKTVRADRGSRSSVALLKIILQEMFGAAPPFTEMIPEADMTPDQGEGLLIIGDRCFQFERALAQAGRDEIHGWDLGDLWLKMTDLPFVFAAWALAPGFVAECGQDEATALRDIMNHARDHGIDRLGDLARREAEHGSLGVGGVAGFEAVDAYLRQSLRYRLGPDELAGMRRFQELGVKGGLFPDLPFPTMY